MNVRGIVVNMFYFELAAMPFPCNGLLLCCVNIPTLLFMFSNKLASCSIPYFNIMSNNMIHQKIKKKRKLAKTNFRKQLGHF